MQTSHRRKNSVRGEQVTDRTLASIVDFADDAIFTLTLSGNITSWNKGAQRLFGYPLHEILGRHVSILAPPERRDEIPEILRRLSQGEFIEHFETLRQRKDGTTFRLSLTISPVRDESGTVIAASTIARDVTTRSRYAEFRNFLASIVDSSDDGILSKDLDGYVLSWNQGAERIYGYTADEMIGSHVSKLVPLDSPDEIPDIMERLRRGERIDHYETVRVTKYGERINISLSVSPIKDNQGNIIAASAVARDITAKKRNEEERARLVGDLQQSLNQKNILLQEVYHRVKNNFQVISSLLDLRSRYVHVEPAKAATAFHESIERIRAMALVHEKLYRAKDLEKLDFKGYLKSLIEQLCRSYAVNKKITLRIVGDSAQFDLNTAIPLSLIFNELVTNSLKHAFPASDHGRIDIHCSANGNSVILRYSDDGQGLPESIDFSKSESFGFRIIDLLIRQIKGRIVLSDHDGKCFEITVPLSSEGEAEHD